MFDGFPQEMIGFLLSIRFNNSTAYFQAHRDEHERFVKRPLYALCEALAPVVQEIDPDLDTRPAGVCSRLRRDTRFSRDKSPYRDHVWIGWRYAGEPRSEIFGLYWDAYPESSSWGCGAYGENKPVMDALRARMLEHPEEMLAILNAPDFKGRFVLEGPDYKKLAVPDALPEALRPLYNKKGFYFHQATDAEQDLELIFSGRIVERVSRDLRALGPLYRYMRRMQAAAGPRERRWDR